MLANVKSFFNNKFIPTVGKLGNQRHLSAIRDAFAIFTPIIIVGSLAVLWRSVLFAPDGGKGTLSGLWVAFNDYHVTAGGHYNSFLSVMNHWMLYIQTGTINVMSIYIAFGIGYFLASSRGNNAPVIAGLTSLASFFAVTNMMISGTWESGMYWLGARGLITAIVLGLIMTELYCFLSKGDKLAIKMPAGVPPAVSRAFAKLFPVIFTVITAALINLLVWMPFFFNNWTIYEGTSPVFTIKAGTSLTADQISALTAAPFKVDAASFDAAGASKDIVFKGLSADDLAKLLKVYANPVKTMIDTPVTGGDVTLTSAIYCGVVAPFIGLAGNTGFAFGLAMLYVLLISFFWFFGLHGTNIVNGAFNPIWLILYAENVAGANHVFVQGAFDAYIFIGGWGATLSLVVATLIFGKKGTASYEVSKFSAAPGLFNINEPVTFGYPLVLNAMLIIPLFIVMPVLVFTTYAGIQWFGVPKVTVLMPWTSPVGFGGMIASGSAWGFVLSVANFLIATVLWTPFVLLNKRAEAKANEAVAA